MKEYDGHLSRVLKMNNGGNNKFYEADSYPWGEDIRKFHPINDWASYEKANKYLEKYWLNKNEYHSKWKLYKDNLFLNNDKSFPDMVFKKDFLIYPTVGGKIFGSWNVKPLNKSLTEINEKSILCIQNTFNGDYIGLNEGLIFNLKYPVGLQWQDINIGNVLTDDLLWGADQDFYVFGENSNWCMYSSTASFFPMNILAFTPKFKDIFIQNFQSIKIEESILKEYLPQEYWERLAK